MTDYAELRALASKATPGPWHCDRASLFIFGPRGGDMIASTDDGDMSPSLLIRGAGARLPMDENAAYIAAANPSAVLAMLDEIERLKAAVDAAGREVHALGGIRAFRDGVEDVASEVRMLGSVIERLTRERDAANAKLARIGKAIEVRHTSHDVTDVAAVEVLRIIDDKEGGR